MILIIDNYDSFVFNVARYFAELGAETRVVRNDAAGVSEIEALSPDAVVISPGPCGPEEAGISLDLIAALSGRVPILGICLGHQCIGRAFGARVVRALEPMHGRASPIRHEGHPLFAGVPETFTAGRYHSLVVEIEAPGPLAVTARSPAGEIMALAHMSHPTWGVQFHPESIMTGCGHLILGNFLKLSAQARP